MDAQDDGLAVLPVIHGMDADAQGTIEVGGVVTRRGGDRGRVACAIAWKLGRKLRRDTAESLARQTCLRRELGLERS